MPSPLVTIVIALDDGLQVVHHSDLRQAPDTYAALVGGLHVTPVILSHDGWQSGIQLGLTALGARALLGVPAAVLTDIDCHLADVLGPSVVPLRDELLAEPTWIGRFAILERWLDARCRYEVAIADEVAEAWRLIRASAGTATISRVAGEIGWSERHLRSRFAAEIGLTPKAAARVVRFDSSRRMLRNRHRAGVDPDLAGLSVACGYADQAHFTREFRDHAGCSPLHWLSEELGAAAEPAEQFRNLQSRRPPERRGSAA
jgi:AraC-like DNA-binding protein